MDRILKAPKDKLWYALYISSGLTLQDWYKTEDGIRRLKMLDGKKITSRRRYLEKIEKDLYEVRGIYRPRIDHEPIKNLISEKFCGAQS